MAHDSSKLLSSLIGTTEDSSPISYGGVLTSAAELLADASSIAASMQERGVLPGDRIAVWLPNVPAWLSLLFAAMLTGSVIVPVNSRYRSSECQALLQRSGAKVLVVWPDFKGIDYLGMLESLSWKDLPDLKDIVFYHEHLSATRRECCPRGAVRTSLYTNWLSNTRLLRAVRLDGPVVGFSTSGTTGHPKLAMHGTVGLLSHAQDVAVAAGYTQRATRIAQLLPFAGSFGLTQALATVVARRPMALAQTFNGAAAAALIQEQHITHLCGTDDMIAAILAETPRHQVLPTGGSWTYARFTPTLTTLVDDADRRGVTLVGAYGSSECQAMFARQDPKDCATDRARPGGRPVSKASHMRIRCPTSGSLLPAGETGELEIQGPNCMLGYWDDLSASSSAFTEDRYVRSGDLGYLKEDGLLVFESRAGEYLRLKGFLVAPAEIENRLQSHPHVAGAQVVGKMTDGGEVAVAFVMCRPGGTLDESQLKAWCGAMLANFKVPHAIVEVDSFPTVTSANGAKVQRQELRKLAERTVTPSLKS